MIGIDIGKNTFHLVGHDEKARLCRGEKFARPVEARQHAVLPDLHGHGMSGVTRFHDLTKPQLKLCGRTEEGRMRKSWLATVAVAAVVGFAGFAAAQSQTDCESKVPPGTTSGAIKQKSGPPLSEDQHSQIKVAVARGIGPRVDRREIHFCVLIGSPVPRSVQFVTLPDEIVRIVPQYRGFDYFIISYRTKDPGGGDYFFVKDELVIIDPKTLEIEAIIPI
jgi:hypothetical protein